MVAPASTNTVAVGVHTPGVSDHVAPGMHHHSNGHRGKGASLGDRGVLPARLIKVLTHLEGDAHFPQVGHIRGQTSGGCPLRG